MTQDNDHITRLLNEAPKVPLSPNLRQDIIASVLLDMAPDVPASPALHGNILATATTNNPATNIIAFPGNSSRQPPHRWLSDNALAGGLMAASLILGIWAGTSGIADNLIAAPLELAGLHSSPNDDIFNFYSVIDGITPSENLL